MILPFAGIAQVRHDPALLTSYQVILCAVLVVAHHGLSFVCGIALVLRD